MQKTLAILNELEAAGLVERYAIGGATAALFYAEPIVTEDLDAFILFKQSSGNILTMTPIYDFLKHRGATEEGEHLWLAGTLVQLIPAYDVLTDEAICEAVAQMVGQTPTRVMRVEHLIAIALKTDRAKDRARIALLVEEANVDSTRLQDILARHDLQDRWEKLNLKP